MVENTSSGFYSSENQKPEKTNQNQDLKENSKILYKGISNLLGVTDSTTTTVHAELKVENNEKKGLNSNERNIQRNKKNEGQKISGKNSSHHRSSDSSGRNSDCKFRGAINSRELIWESKFQITRKVRKVVIEKECDIFRELGNISYTCFYTHKRQKAKIQKENLSKLLIHDPCLNSPSQILLNIPSYKTHKPKVQVFDPNNKINQPVLFHDLLSQSEKLKINYEKFAEEIIKISFVKSKDRLADFLFNAFGSKALKNIFGK